MAHLKNFIKQDRGVTAIEYALIAGLIALIIIAAVTTLGNRVSAKFQSIATAIT